MTSTELTTINFHGAKLAVIPGRTPADTLVAMKPIVEGMGLDWKSQSEKLKTHPVLSTCMVLSTIQVPGDDQAREHTCLALNRVHFWMATVHPDRVAPEIRDTVIRYQTECAEALFAHFFGKLVNTRLAPMSPTSIRLFARDMSKLYGSEAAAEMLRDLGVRIPECAVFAQPKSATALTNSTNKQHKTDNKSRIFDVIKSAGKIGISKSDIVKKTQYLAKSPERCIILSDLVASGFVDERVEQRKTKKATIYVAVRTH